jgi:hypothetical protein
MTEPVKMTSVSARVEETLAQQFDTVAKMTQINKSDFLRSCIQKLCTDNEILLEHYDKVSDYVDFVRCELSKLPKDLIEVKNGAWKDVKESTLLFLMDEFWKTSPSMFNFWKQILEQYKLTALEDVNDFSEAKESDGLLSLGSIVMLMAEKSGEMEPVDVPLLLKDVDWVDSVELTRIALSYACEKAFENESALFIVKAYLEAERAKKGSGPRRIVLDASGKFRRSGAMLYLPVDTVEIGISDDSKIVQKPKG